MNNDIIKVLLDKVSVIYNEYAQAAEESGDNFNIFRIIKFETKERQVHSSFLAELLNYKGSHSKGEFFIKSFIELVRNKKPELTFEFNPSDAITQVDKYIGVKSEISGGYIDILISDRSKNQIIIENKIYHGDEPQQLLRYHRSNPKAPIIYLTLDGHEPNDHSLKFEDKHVANEQLIFLSYKDDILKWLEMSLKEIKDPPPLKEIIKQYINLIRNLTGQTMNDKMINEITNIITEDPVYIEAAFAVYSSMDQLKRKMMDDFLSKVREDLKELGLKFKKDPNFGLNCEEYIYVSRDVWTYDIEIDFEEPYSNLVIGIYRKDNEDSKDEKFKNNVRACLSKLNIGETLIKDNKYENWIWLSSLEGFSLANDPKEWTKLKDPVRKDILVNTIRKILEELETDGIKL